MMNNPMQLLGMIKNPQTFMHQMMNQNQIMQNPLAKNAMEMLQRGDNEGLEKMARNLCAEKGINPDEALKQIKSQFGM